jgi:hypothetical protein
MGYFSKPWRWLVAPAAIGVLFAAGCGGDGDSSPVVTPTPTPEPRPVLIAWSALYLEMVGSYGCDDLRMLQNFFQALGQKQTGLRIRMINDTGCDPRTDSERCGITSDWSQLAPFFNMIDGIGTLEYGPLASIDPLTYDVLILHGCWTDVGAIRTTLDRFVTTATHGGILVVGSHQCMDLLKVTGAEKANILVSSYGIQYGTASFTRNRCNAVGEVVRTGLMKDVTSSTLLYTVPLEVSAPARTLFATSDSRPLAAVYERVNP